MAQREPWREDRAYGAGDYERERWGPEDASRRADESRAWRPYEPGPDSPDLRDRSGPRWRFDDSGQDDRAPAHPEAPSQERGFWDRAADQVASWWGDHAAEQRREEDGQHRGRGPRGYRRSDARISEDIHDHLTEDSWLDASDIEVRVHAGEVELRGRVRNETDRRRAGEIADRVAGVMHVHNELRVGEAGRSWTDSGLYPF